MKDLRKLSSKTYRIQGNAINGVVIKGKNCIIGFRHIQQFSVFDIIRNPDILESIEKDLLRVVNSNKESLYLDIKKFKDRISNRKNTVLEKFDDDRIIELLAEKVAEKLIGKIDISLIQKRPNIVEEESVLPQKFSIIEPEIEMKSGAEHEVIEQGEVVGEITVEKKVSDIDKDHLENIRRLKNEND